MISYRVSARQSTAAGLLQQLLYTDQIAPSRKEIVCSTPWGWSQRLWQAAICENRQIFSLVAVMEQHSLLSHSKICHPNDQNRLWTKLLGVIMYFCTMVGLFSLTPFTRNLSQGTSQNEFLLSYRKKRNTPPKKKKNKNTQKNKPDK